MGVQTCSVLASDVGHTAGTKAHPVLQTAGTFHGNCSLKMLSATITTTAFKSTTVIWHSLNPTHKNHIYPICTQS